MMPQGLSDQVISLTSMSDFNDYLIDLNTSLDTSLKSLMTTIAGVDNANSVEWVKLTDRSLTDKLLSKWPDGKLDSYEYTNDCLKAGLLFRREFYEDSDVEQKNSLMFKITFIPFTGVKAPVLNP